MPAFRVGKPRVELLLTGDQTAGATPYPVVWDTASRQGDWTGSDATSQVITREGLWVATFLAVRTAGSTSQSCVPQITRNGVVHSENWSTASASLRRAACAMLLTLLVGDVIQFQLIAANTGTSKLGRDSFATLSRVGPKAWT